MNRPDFIIIPWQEDFLPALLRLALEEGGGRLDDALFIFPHARPARYLERLIRLAPDISKPCLLPEMLPVHGLFEKLHARLLGPAINIGLLDQVGLLLECVRAEQNEPTGQNRRSAAINRLPAGDAKAFFPWGIRLANLFEDCFIHDIKPNNFAYLDGELAEYAVALLEHLGNLHTRYVKALTERNWTTNGFTALKATSAFVKNAEKKPLIAFGQNTEQGHLFASEQDHLTVSEQNRLFAGKRIYLAGFYSLNGCEDKIFHKFWEAGARVILHADPALQHGKAHWSCAELDKWRKRWKAGLNVADSPANQDSNSLASNPACQNQSMSNAEQSSIKPRITYYSGYDLHSQLAALQNIMAENKDNNRLPFEHEPACQNNINKADNTIFIKSDMSEDAALAQDDMSEDAVFAKSGDVAVILPEADLLLPTLHHLRHYDLNISMGYPLDKTPLSRLIDNILLLQENHHQDGYYWKDLLSLLRHPYVKMLNLNSQPVGYFGNLNNNTPDAISKAMQGFTHEALPGAMPNDLPGAMSNDLPSTMPNDLPSTMPNDLPGTLTDEQNSALWRSFLHRLESRLRQGRRFTDAAALLRETALSFENTAEQAVVLALSEKLQKNMFDNWSNLQTLSGLATALDGLCTLLLEQGEALWPRFPIDAECLYRLMQNILPQIRSNAMSRESLPPEELFAILRQLLAQERVPFDAYPLTAMQVMGLLESRLLHFRKICILEATDNALPGGMQSDPLLPDSLRLELGLPDTFRKQQMSAYYFFRLLQGAEEVHLLWQEGTEPQGLQDAKKLRSRFIEELLWQEEQKLGRRLQPESGPECRIAPDHALSESPLCQLTCAPGAVLQTDRRIIPGAELDKLVASRLQNRDKPISASLLNSFLTCPQAFYFGELAGLKPLTEVIEEEDPGETGQLIHQVFAEHYAGKLGQELHQETQSLTELNNTFRRQLQHSEIPEKFPQDTLAGLRVISPMRLRDYLRNQPKTTKVLALEVTAESTLSTSAGFFYLAGRIDRIDERVTPEFEVVEVAAENAVSTKPDTIFGSIPGEPQIISPKNECTLAGELAECLHTKGKNHREFQKCQHETDEKPLVLLVLDYKTGKTAPPKKDFWQDTALWAAIDRAANLPENFPDTEAEELLLRLAKGLNGNIQLPFYLYLLRFGRLHQGNGLLADELAGGAGEQLDKTDPLVNSKYLKKYASINAAWIELGFQGKEQPLFSDEYSTAERMEIIERKIPALLGFVLSRLLTGQKFNPRRGRHCAYCAYAGLCTVAS